MNNNKRPDFLGGLSFEAVNCGAKHKYDVGDIVYDFSGDPLEYEEEQLMTNSISAGVVIGMKMEIFSSLKSPTIHTTDEEWKKVTCWIYLVSCIGSTKEKWVAEYELFSNPLVAYSKLKAAIESDVEYWEVELSKTNTVNDLFGGSR